MTRVGARSEQNGTLHLRAANEFQIANNLRRREDKWDGLSSFPGAMESQGSAS